MSATWQAQHGCTRRQFRRWIRCQACEGIRKITPGQGQDPARGDYNFPVVRRQRRQYVARVQLWTSPGHGSPIATMLRPTLAPVSGVFILWLFHPSVARASVSLLYCVSGGKGTSYLAANPSVRACVMPRLRVDLSVP